MGLRTARFFSSEQALGEGPRQRRRIECLEEAQSIVAGFTSSVSDRLPVIPYVRLTILQSSASSRQSIPGLRPAPSPRGDAFDVILKFRGASDFMRRTTISHFSFLISHSSKTFIHNPRVNPEPRIVFLRRYFHHDSEKSDS